MVYKKIEVNEGPYINDDGSYFDILESTKVVSPQGINIGWDTFNDIEEAAKAYGLTRIPEPEEPEEPEEDRDEVSAPESIEDLIQEIIDEEVNK